MENETTKITNVRSILGSINGIFLYDLAWPYLVILLMHFVLKDNYNNYVDNNYYTMSLVFMIFTMIITLLVSVFIAKPKLLLSEYKSINVDKVKFIFKCLGWMIVITFAYNFFMLLLQIDPNGGNANQNIVLDMIHANPVLSFFSMIILAPILEEITYRYFLYGGIAKYSRKWAIVISGFVFMCVHATASFSMDNVDIVRELLLLPPYMFSGMILAYAYDKTGNLTTSTAIHSLNNLISFIVSFI